MHPDHHVITGRTVMNGHDFTAFQGPQHEMRKSVTYSDSSERLWTIESKIPALVFDLGSQHSTCPWTQYGKMEYHIRCKDCSLRVTHSQETYHTPLQCQVIISGEEDSYHNTWLLCKTRQNGMKNLPALKRENFGGWFLTKNLSEWPSGTSLVLNWDDRLQGWRYRWTDSWGRVHRKVMQLNWFMKAHPTAAK